MHSTAWLLSEMENSLVPTDKQPEIVESHSNIGLRLYFWVSETLNSDLDRFWSLRLYRLNFVMQTSRTM